MNSTQQLSLFNILRRLFTRRDKKVLILLLFASILVSIVEMIGVSAVMVFISVATNFGTIQNSIYFSKIYHFLGCEHPHQFVVMLGIGLLGFYIFRMLLNAVHIYYMNKFANMRQYYFSTRVFHRFLLLGYKDFTLKSSAQIGQIVIGFTSNITQIISALLSIGSESFTISCIYIMLFYVNWKMTLVLTFLLAFTIFFIIKIFSSKIRAAGKHAQEFSIESGRAFSQAYSNYKFLKLLSNDDVVRDRFATAQKGLARANTTNAIWQALPRYVLETIGFSILISVIVYVVWMYHNAAWVIPTVTMYALAFYRFLPSINKIMMGYNQIQFNKHAPGPVYDFLQHEFEQLGNQSIAFTKAITLKNIWFKYSEKSKVFNDASIVITKGQRVGFVGVSGAGKSTIADIIMGLFTLDKGQLLIDDQLITQKNVKAWRQVIGYIPQNFHLFDGTIAENVSCGRPLNEGRVIGALQKAHIYDFLQSKDGIHTRVGEGGVLLSGGQQQRVIIARALYDNPQVLVLDEATSALDNATEGSIMDEIYNVSTDKTLIVIAHRLTTIERCDKVYKLEHGNVHDASEEYCKKQGKEAIKQVSI